MPTYCFECQLSSDQYEQKLALWYTMGMQGCEEQSDHDNVNIKVYFDSVESVTAAIAECKETNPDQNPTWYEIEKQDWNAKWRESMEPAKLAPGYWVSPLWLPPALAPDDIWIKIEPKMAFGTGHHETTRLAAAALIEYRSLVEKRCMVDVGTGSGVLCFVGDSLGAARCIGIEIDKDCQENLAENYGLNSPTGRIDFLIGITDALKPTFLSDIIVMNMILTESSPLLMWAFQTLRKGGLLILSGVLVDEYTNAINLAAQVSCTLKSERRENEWWCGVFVKS